jgi:opacity protein-like surface antigen
LEYTLTAGCRYAFTPNLSAELTYALNLGRNVQDGVTNPQYREFDENLVSLGAVFKF